MFLSICCVYAAWLVKGFLLKFRQKGFWQESRETFQDGIFLRWWWKKCVTNLLHSTWVWDLGLGAIPPIWACRTPGSQYVFWIQIWVQYWPMFTPVCTNVCKSWYKIQMLMYYPKNTRVSVWTLAHSVSASFPVCFSELAFATVRSTVHPTVSIRILYLYVTVAWLYWPDYDSLKGGGSSHSGHSFILA